MGTTGTPNVGHTVPTGAGRVAYGSFTMSSSYATSGDTVAGGPGGLGVNSLSLLIVHRRGTTEHTFQWDGGGTTVKVVAFSAATEVANTTDLSAVTCDYIAVGR